MSSPNPSDADNGIETTVPLPPRGLAVLMVLGPGLVWCGEYIGTGEVVLATRTGAILGIMILWAPILGICLKTWIGLAGARYTVCTGEGMIDMISRTPGPRNWVLWPVFVGQLCAAAISTGAVASMAGVFLAYFIPVKPFLLGWLITLGVIALTWSGRFDILKKVMAILVGIIVLGAFDVARSVWPGWGAAFTGTLGFQVPDVPQWAWSQDGVAPSPWSEILPLLGWSAGGFASQVWYTYWVLGAGYGMAHGRGYGKPLDAQRLGSLSTDTAHRLKKWCRVVYMDAGMALIVGVAVTAAFLIAGAGILRPEQIAPEGPSVALDLSRIFSERWGEIGANLFILAGLAAMISTLLGQFAGWPRLLADCGRILIPGVSRYSWKVQFRVVLLCFAASNMIVVYSFGLKPVFLVQLSAVLDGLLLTPLQALSVGLVLYLVMPKLFSQEARRILKPNPIFAVGLILAFVMFTYFCVFQIPHALGMK